MKPGLQLSDVLPPASFGSDYTPHQIMHREATVHPYPRRNLHPTVSPTDDELICKSIKQQKLQRTDVFTNGLQSSLIRVAFSVASIALLLTDIPRSGIGINNLSKYFAMVEPDLVVVKGMPWNYPVFQSTLEEAKTTSASVWSYKYDTTSIVWRAFAKHLNVTEFPSCLHYEESCPSSKLGGDVIFTFMDSLVDAIDATSLSASSLTSAKRKRKTLLLRTENEFYDRVHEYVLATVLRNLVWRTNQALYQSEQALLGNNRQLDYSLPCSGRLRPVFCQEVWVNLDRMHCRGTNPCDNAGTVYSHSIARVKDVRDRFPNATVDLTFLESFEDLRVSRMSIGAEATRGADVSTIIRARQCNTPATGNDSICKTIYVEDYRYEADVISTDVAQWYFVVLILRICGQGYFFFRVAGLALSCYHAFDDGNVLEGESLRTRIHKTLNLLSKVPTQCIVFGSSLPIVSYSLAHLIDGSITYRILQMRFITQNGILRISLRGFFSVAVIQMRCVWVYATLTHLLVRAATSHRWVGWPRGVIGGVSGVSEYFLTSMASITIIAQFRSTRLRSSRILAIWEIASPGTRSVRGFLQIFVFSHHGRGSSHFGGVAIDLKFLLCIVIVIGAISFCRLSVRRIRQFRFPKTDCHYSDYTLWPLGRTPVPYSADILWPAVSLCVHWTGDFFCIRKVAPKQPFKRPLRIIPQPTSIAATSSNSPSRLPLRHFATPTIRMSGRVFNIIQRQLESLHDRTSEVEGNVAFMNLVLMSDPLVYFQLRFGDDPRKSLAYYQSLEQPTRVLLLPEAAVTVENEPMCHLRLMRRVHIQDMRWSELVHCG